MTTWHSAQLGIRTSGDYFISTFLFGLMFGIAAAASGIEIALWDLAVAAHIERQARKQGLGRQWDMLAT